jgi:hypothetical protein
MYHEIAIFFLGFAAGYFVRKNQNNFLYNGLSLATFLNKWRNDIKDFLTYDYIIKGAVYNINGDYQVLNDADFDVTESGIHSYGELKELPLLISYNYKKVNYILKLKDARQIKELQFKSNGKNINKFLSVNIDNKEVLQDLRVFAGPFGNFYGLSDITFDDLYPGCENIELINEFGDLEKFKGNVNIISLI